MILGIDVNPQERPVPLTRTLYEKFLDLFLIRSDEVGLLVLLGANVFFSIHSLIISQIVGESLFLSAYDRTVLAYMYGAAGLSAAIAGTLYARFQNRVRPGYFELSVLAFFFAAFVALWFLTYVGGKPVFIALLIFAEVFGTIIIIQAWSITGALLSARSAKRLVPVVGGFGTIAGISAGLLVGGLAEVIGTANLIGLVLASLLGCVAMTRALLRRMSSAASLVESSELKRGGRRKVPGRQLYRNRFFQILALMTTIATLASILVDFQFKVFSQAYFTVDGVLNKDALSQFYGFVQIVVTSLALVVTFGLASRVLERYGLAATLILLPGVIFLGTAGIVLGIGGYFVAATLARGGDKVLRFSVYGSANQILYLALPDRMQKSARAVANGVWRPITIVVASLLLVLLTGILGLPDAQISYVTGVIAIVWIGLSVTTGRQYLVQLLQTVERRRIHFEKEKAVISDPKVIEEITESLASKKPNEVLEALALSARISGHDLCAQIQARLGDSGARIRRRALLVAVDKGCVLDEPALRPLLSDPDEDARVAAIRAYGQTASESRDSVLETLIDDEDLATKSAAIQAVLANSASTLQATATHQLDDLLGADDPDARVAGLDALVATPVSVAVERLLPLLNDPESRVQDRAIRIGTEVGDSRLHAALLEHLKAGVARPIMVDAFRGADAEVVQVLRGILLERDNNIRSRALAARILGNIGSEDALDALLARMEQNDIHPAIESAKAAAGIVAASKQVLPREKVDAILNDLVLRLYQMTAWRVDTQSIRGSGNLDFLDAVIRDRRSCLIEAIFLVLRMLYPPQTIEIAQRYLNDRSSLRRDNALEILAQALNRSDKRAILPQLESDSPQKTLEAGGTLIPVQRQRGDMWVGDWLESDDPWLQAASLWALTTTDPTGYISVVEQCLSADHPLIRETAAVVLTKAAERGNLEDLIGKLLDDPNATVRARAAELLAV